MIAKTTALLSLVAAAVLTAPTTASAQVAEHAETQAALNSYLAHAGPGASVYAGDATGSWSVQSGTATPGKNVAIKPDDHFRVASQTKIFTAAAVLKLVDDGAVQLDAPIEGYLPGVVTGNGYDGTLITVRQLLQHTSGIAENQTAPNPQAGPDGIFSLAELVRDGLSHTPVFPPGGGFQYSNTNYQILGLLIEAVTGQPAEEAIAARIFQPLGLTGTSFPANKSLPAPYLHGYEGGRIGPIYFWNDVSNWLDPNLLRTAGSAVSTQTDLAEFEQSLAAGEVVSPALLAEMRETVAIPGGAHAITGDGYGLGAFRLDLPCGGQAWGHAGDTKGYSSLTMATDDGRYASLVTNTIVTSTNNPGRFTVVETALCEGK
ncbi:serine hydrolase [Amycolatopsis sp. 195334CR]|uniref:serine hydrolase domain-containing protein n=1 Tax=Amycolatopsis sp. 195334CR TaxID=2814588 RepID=UPI001A8C6706|nr:serine hydrolase domain-containing protein [Amycolatopsis sp. 195334CR]MBN6036530.1 beta-lactamase family protein [Amycolatopsis sp. 195334CR]